MVVKRTRPRVLQLYGRQTWKLDQDSVSEIEAQERTDKERY